jgi:hypothetical protein
MQFELTPYERAGPLMFGMNISQVESALGAPLRVGKSRKGDPRVHYQDCTLAFDKLEKLVEITFVPSASLLVEGIDLFKSPEPLKRLRQFESSPLELAGILFFPMFGLTLSGFHTQEEKTATALARGRIDRLLPNFRPMSVMS